MAFHRESSKIIALLFSALLLLLAVVWYSINVKNFFTEDAFFCVEDSTKNMANSIDSMVFYGTNSVQLASLLTEQKSPENLETFLSELKSDTPFTYLDYFDLNGNNTLTDINHNASDKEYFIKAMKGETGIFINYNPINNPDNTVINFFTPVYKNNKIKGIINGAIEGNIELISFIQQTFYGEPMVCVLLDSDFRVISSSDSVFPTKISLQEYEEVDFVKSVIRSAKRNDTRAFHFNYEDKKGIASVCKLTSTDWYVIQIVSNSAFNKVMHSITNKTVALVLFIIITLLTYVIYLVFKNNYIFKVTEMSNVSIIRALSSTYENVFSINLNTGYVKVYHLDQRIKESYGKIEDYEESISYYVSKEIYKPDVVLFEKIITLDNVRKLFEKKNKYSFVYRTQINDLIQHFECQIIKPFEISNEFVIASKNISHLLENSKAKIEEN